MNEEKLIQLKPVFIAKKNLLIYGGKTLFHSIFILIVILITISDPSIKTLYAPVPICIILWSIAWGVILGGFFINEKFNYKFTEYIIYDDRIEFHEGFINTKFTTLSLIDIKEFHLEKSFFQKFWDLGTIRFITAANSNAPKSFGVYDTGVNFRDIQNSSEVYAEIKKLMETQKAKQMGFINQTT
ncbi:MAG: PH domain-containing protein [bacterium]